MPNAPKRPRPHICVCGRPDHQALIRQLGEVIAAIERGADEALTESTAKANQRADVAEAEVRRLRQKLARIKNLLDEGPDDD